MKKQISRRNFLLAAGGTGLLLPFMPSLLPKAFAFGTKPPKRFICVFHRYGHHQTDFNPSFESLNKFNENTYYSRLSDIPGNMSAVFNEKFDPYRSKMNIYLGLDSIGGGGHNTTVPLMGAGYVGAEGENNPSQFGRSIDVLMSQSPNVYNTLSRFDAIRIGNNFDGTGKGCSWDRDASGTGIRLNQLASDNATVFNSIFGGTNSTPAGQAELSQHTLIIDKVAERYQAFKKLSRLSSADKARVDQHIAGVTDLEKRLMLQGNCSAPPGLTNAGPVAAELIWRNNVDALVSAMSCDMTRVGVLSIADYQFGVDQNYGIAHAVSHDREGNPASAALSAQYSSFKADQILHLLDKLNSTIESDGSTMLDNTLVLWTAELTNGNFHVSSSLPVATFGGAGGAIHNGYLMDFRLRPHFQYLAGRSDFAPLGQSYNRLLITIMQAMGMQPSEYLKEGDGGGFGQFKTDIQYLTNQYTQYFGQRNDPLPIVFG